MSEQDAYIPIQLHNSRKPLRKKAKTIVPPPVQPPRKTRLAAKSVVTAEYLPMVLVSDIAGMENQPRVPFSKVDPVILTDEPSVESSAIRRNAARACRKADIDYSYANLIETGKTESQHSATATNTRKAEPSKASSSSSSWRPRRGRANSLLEAEPHRCRFCEKPFTTSDAAEVHESSCSNSQTGWTSLDDSNSQTNFMSFLGMQRTGINVATSVPLDVVPSPSGSQTTSKPSPNDRQARSKRLGAAAYFRNNPGIPINSQRGLNKIKELGSGLCADPEQLVRNYEKFCQPPSRFNAKEDNKTWPTAISKKMKFKSNDHVHEYSFNRAERIVKINEAAIGLNPRYFKLLNKMKVAKIKVKRMQDSEIAKAMSLQPKALNKQKPTHFTLKKLEINLVDISETEEGQMIISKYSTSNASAAPAVASSTTSPPAAGASPSTSPPAAVASSSTSSPAVASSSASPPAVASSSTWFPAVESSSTSFAVSPAKTLTRNLRKLRPTTY